MRKDLEKYYKALRKHLIKHAEAVVKALNSKKITAEVFVKGVPLLTEDSDSWLVACLRSNDYHFYLATKYDIKNHKFGGVPNEKIISVTKLKHIVIVKL